VALPSPVPGSKLVDGATVHAFDLVGHAKARAGYAWSRMVDGNPEFRAVLQLGP